MLPDLLAALDLGIIEALALYTYGLMIGCLAGGICLGLLLCWVIRPAWASR